MREADRHQRFIIKFTLPDGQVISTLSTWNEEIVLKKIADNPEWEFTVIEDNYLRKVWIAK